MAHLTQSTMTTLSTFSGAGGLDLGLEAAGFKTLACIEIDERARDALARNRPSWNLLDEGDIANVAATLTPRTLGIRKGELGILCGGPPCQPFSKAAQWNRSSRKGLADPRSTPLEAFFELANRFRPKVILIENVQGFIDGPVSALDRIEHAVSQMNRQRGENYHLFHRVLNCCDFGVPQRRKRAIIHIVRGASNVEWPIETHSNAPVRSWDALANIKPQNPPRAGGKWADLLPSIPEGENYLWHTPDGGGLPLFGYRTRFWSFLLKLAKKHPAWTIPAQPGPGCGPFHWDNRPLAIEEAARLQTFPKSWNFSGGHREKMKQVGNATPPLLAEVLGRNIADQFFGEPPSTRPKFHIARKRSIPKSKEVSQVSQKYIILRGDHKPHPGNGNGPSPRN